MGKKKGRRLKRYLGLRRAKGAAFYGGIDHLLPSKILGWVSAADPSTLFYEVRLLVGPHLIARVEIDHPRPDVCEQLGCEGTPGFVIPLPFDLPPLDWSLPVRVLAVSADGSFHVELSLLQKQANTSERLSALLQSDQRGMDGHVDGIQHGELVGWAGRRDQSQPAQIWLHAKGRQPIAIACGQWREGMSNQQLPNQSGFAFAVDSLPSNWGGQKIWCSFDQADQWPIPQNQTLGVPVALVSEAEMVHRSPEVTSVVTSAYSAQLQAAPEDLQPHWRALEEFSLFLDGLEAQVQRRESLIAFEQDSKAHVSPQRGNLLRRLLRGR
jgi:hypothetical protein